MHIYIYICPLGSSLRIYTIPAKASTRSGSDSQLSILPSPRAPLPQQYTSPPPVTQAECLFPALM